MAQALRMQSSSLQVRSGGQAAPSSTMRQKGTHSPFTHLDSAGHMAPSSMSPLQLLSLPSQISGRGPTAAGQGQLVGHAVAVVVDAVADLLGGEGGAGVAHGAGAHGVAHLLARLEARPHRAVVAGGAHVEALVHAAVAVVVLAVADLGAGG